MQQEIVTFGSHGAMISGLLRTPDSPGPWPGIVQGPGWLGLKDAKLYNRYHEAFTGAGYAVLIFDYRGFGDSGGDRATLSPSMQLQDLVSAVTYLRNRQDVSDHQIGVFGSGGTGGGNAVLLAAVDDRVRGIVSQVPVSDGRDWLRRMRTADQWDSFLSRIEADRAARSSGESGELVHPREEIMIPSEERRTTTVKSDVDGRIPTSVPLSAAEEIFEYRPVDAASRVGGLMIVAVEDDLVTPTDHALALFEAAQEPKSLLVQQDTTHYAAYGEYGHIVIPRMVEWFNTHTRGIGSAPTGPEVIR